MVRAGTSPQVTGSCFWESLCNTAVLIGEGSGQRLTGGEPPSYDS